MYSGCRFSCCFGAGLPMEVHQHGATPKFCAGVMASSRSCPPCVVLAAVPRTAVLASASPGLNFHAVALICDAFEVPRPSDQQQPQFCNESAPQISGRVIAQDRVLEGIGHEADRAQFSLPCVRGGRAEPRVARECTPLGGAHVCATPCREPELEASIFRGF